jgi:cytoskeleton protein RodZ
MGTQGKLPLDKEGSRLNLSIGDGAEDQSATAQLTSEKKIYSQKANTPTQKTELPVEPVETYLSNEDTENLSLGAHLRLERERQNLTIYQVAESLRLRPKQLLALEDGNYEALPGHTFVLGFLRSYANFLRLDAVAIVDLFKKETAGETDIPELAFPEPTSEGRMPGSNLLIASCAMAAVVFGGWYYYQSENRLGLEMVSELPEQIIAKITSTGKEPAEEVVAKATNDAVVLTPALTDDAKDSAWATEPEVAAAPAQNITQSAQEAKNLATEQVQIPKEPAVADQNAPSIVQEPQQVLPQSADVKTPAPEASIAAAAPESATKPTAEPNRETPSIEVPNTDAPKIVAATEDSAVPSQLPETTISVEEPKPSDPTVADTSKTLIAQKVEPEVTQVAEAAPAAPSYSQTQVAAVLPQALEVDASEPAAETLGVENTDARVVLIARQETWIQVNQTDAGVVMDRVLAAGDTYMLPNEQGLTLSVANAGGLEIRLDGQPMGLLGGYGEIVRSLSVDPENLKASLTAIQ